MYVVTFYSYKGGVGRSMALANVAALLTQQGRKVLVVDFDLEAPGLPSYGPFGRAVGLPGVVDYIEQYRSDLKAPDASEFIVECALGEGNPIWVMPAGDNRSPAYSGKLGSVDWKELYENEHGFLMFEDLRQQWERHPARFDYVLIDSRTGNTDVGGICTRQLPDAVVFMFVPTEQNIAGLAPIVSDVREAKRPGDLPIRLHFCASNVPDEYDEDGVLADRLKAAQAGLGYGRQAAIEPRRVIVHHRSDLELLEQKLIVLERAKSKLAKEYGDLKTSIVGENLADRDGAMVTLERLPKIYEQARRRQDGQFLIKIADRAREALRLHPADGEIAIQAAHVFSLVGEYHEELASLGVAIEAGHRADYARLRRAGALLTAGRDQQAIEDLRALLASPTGTIFEFVPATSLLEAAADDPVAEAIELVCHPETRPRAKVALAQQLLMTDRSNMALVADEMRRILDSAEMSQDLSGDVRNAAQLAFIATRDFEAVERLRPDPASVVDGFNDAIAQWGKIGKIPVDAFRRIDAMRRNGPQDANAHQCYALVKAALGDAKGASAELDAAVRRAVPNARIFSCWTYLYGTGEAFLGDVREMQARLRAGGPLKPPFLDGTEG